VENGGIFSWIADVLFRLKKSTSLSILLPLEERAILAKD
jgi:hypothetical protein